MNYDPSSTSRKFVIPGSSKVRTSLLVYYQVPGRSTWYQNDEVNLLFTTERSHFARLSSAFISFERDPQPSFDDAAVMVRATCSTVPVPGTVLLLAY